MDYTFKKLTFKKKIGMIGTGNDWVCVAVREYKKIPHHCMMAVEGEGLKIIGTLEEQLLLDGIANGDIIVGEKTKFLHKTEKPKI